MGRRIVEVVVGSGVVMEEEEGRGEGARGERYGREEMRDGSVRSVVVLRAVGAHGEVKGWCDEAE